MDNASIIRREPSPQDNANVFSRLFFVWFGKICVKCVKFDFNFNNIFACSPSNKSNQLTSFLQSNWNYEVFRARNKHDEPSLLRAIRKTFFWYYFAYGLLFFLYSVILSPMQPVLLHQLIHLFSVTPSEEESEYHLKMMCIYAGSIILVSIVSIFINNHVCYIFYRTGMHVRVACSALVYRKVLRLSSKSLNKSASGYVINLLSNDVDKFDQAAIFFIYIWTSPLMLICATAFVWFQMQVAGMVGIAIFILTIPLQVMNGKYIAKLAWNVSENTDLRVKTLSEVFSGIRLIKLYAWEIPFEKLINLIRTQEIRILSRSLNLQGIIISCWNFAGRFILFVTVIIYTLTGHSITAAQIFSISLIFTMLQQNIIILLPLGINYTAESAVSVRRIQEFLLLEEKEDSLEITYDTSSGITLKDVQISWNPELPILRNLNIHIKPGSLCAVVGPVGAGKSSLLQLLLGELSRDRGTISIGGTISYASQKPWLFASTVKHNILFGTKYYKNHYEDVVQVCALKRDFDLFPHGDGTLVGEKGVSLSGGQKARINLARAVYREADIYLLDDPLSAVDAHVGKELFKNCFVNYLKGKTRVLVTHQLQFLKHVDHIVVISNGKIEAQGTFSEISNINIDFTKLLNSSEKESSEEKEEIENTKEQSVEEMNSELEDSVKNEEDEEIKLNFKREQSTFWKFIKTTPNKCLLILLFIFLICAQGFSVCSDLWLTFWTSHEVNQTQELNITSPDISSQTSIAFKHIILTRDNVLCIYAGIILILIIFAIGASLLFYKTYISIIKSLHNQMFDSILHAPIKFFDSHSSGKILNRFSRDMGMVDTILPRTLHLFTMVTLIIIGTLVVVFIANQYMIAVVFILAILLNIVRKWYIIVTENLKHLESAVKSPIYSYINATWNGAVTIRSTKMEPALKKEFDGHQDTHTSIFNFYIASISAFGLWIDLISWVFLSCVIISFVIMNQFKVVSGSLAGLAISQTATLAGTIQLGISQIAFCISQMISVQRIVEYSNVEKEDTKALINSELISFWPYHGKIEFINVSLRYSMTEPPVLKNLNFSKLFRQDKWSPVKVVSGSLAGLAISQTATLAGTIQLGISQIAFCISQMISVQRIVEYSNVEKEDTKALINSELISFWPYHGKIEFINVSLRYSMTEPPVLKNLNFTINAKEKVGIVGRTGAGKSSLISVLFRLTATEGHIVIDDVDINEISLKDLRSNITIIPQEPVLFSASLRYNLDPFEQFTDDEIWNSLEDVELRRMISSLDYLVEEGGSNFSVGQRQLICLARAILRQNKILVLDEATANIDQKTDELIQTTIRRKFIDCTVLTVAHRLNTIMDSDKIMVLDVGEIVEFDDPRKLLENEQGFFFKMVADSNITL